MSYTHRLIFVLAATVALPLAAQAVPRADDMAPVKTSCATTDQACMLGNFKTYKAAALDAVGKWASLEGLLKQALDSNDQTMSLEAFNQATTMGLSGRYRALQISSDDLIRAGVDQNELYGVDTCRVAAIAIAGVAMNMAYARWSEASFGLQEYLDAAQQCEKEFKLPVPADGFSRNP